MEALRELAVFAFPFLETWSIIRAILGLILVFFLPGFAWSLVFFRQINVLVRVALSLGLSLAVVTLSLMVVSRLGGVSITGSTPVWLLAVITVPPLIIYYLARRIRRRKTV